MKEELKKLKENYENQFSTIIITGIRDKKIRVTGKLTGLSVHTVNLFENSDDHTESNFLCQILTENVDEELSELKEYGYEPVILQPYRKELFEYIKNNLNK